MTVKIFIFYRKLFTKNQENDENTVKINTAAIKIFKDPFIIILTICNFCFATGYIIPFQHVKVIINILKMAPSCGPLKL